MKRQSRWTRDIWMISKESALVFPTLIAWTAIDQEQSRVSIKAGPRKDDNEISRLNSRTSTRSRISRIATNLTSKSKKARLAPAPLPVSDLDNDIVGWESQDDPEMPLNFSEKRKWLLISLLGSITFISPLASSMFAPGVSFMNKDFDNTSLILSSLTVSIFVLGYVVGPLILAPLSEIYGRRFVLTGANAFFCVVSCIAEFNLAILTDLMFL